MFRLGLVLICSSCFAAGPSAADLAKSIRAANLDPAECYRVRDIRFQKEDIKVYLSGYVIFAKPVEGAPRAALFAAEGLGADGEVLLLPPTRGERQSLAFFTQSANLDEHFNAALMIFTDGATELRQSIRADASTKKAEDVGAAMAQRWDSALDGVRSGMEMRMMVDLLGPANQPGMLFLALQGREAGNFDVLYDPRARDQVEAGQLTERNGRPVYNVWTSFPSRSVRMGTLTKLTEEFAPSDYRIEATVDNDLSMRAVTRVKVKVGPQALRGFPFEISNAMKVTAAKIDGAPAEVLAESSLRGRALRGNDNDVFLVTAAEALGAGTTHEFEFEHEGAVITPAGNHVFFVGSRAGWYPRYSDEFATYDLTFHYPKRWTLVAAGDQVSDAAEGDTRVTRWRTPVPIRMAGFNLGDYQKVTGDAPGFKVEVYGNKSVEAALMPKVRAATLPPLTPTKGQFGQIESLPQAGPPPDPAARLRDVAADVTSALEFLSGKFGAPALKTLTVAPIPGMFGQGFPGLVYLSTLSYLDPSQRPAPIRNHDQDLFFSDIMVAHEVAHQWWGDVVTGASYQDEWMMEALANYSALLWLEHKKGPKAMESVLDDYRDHLLSKGQDGKVMESAGPIVWGTRLESAGVNDAWRVITYEKGSWIIHMMRRRLGDERFFKMLGEMRRRYEFRTMTTEQFRALAKEFLPPRAAGDTMENFFDNWVYSTGVPGLKVKYSARATAAGVRVSGTIAQSGVDEDFSADVPVEIQFARGSAQTVWVRTTGDATAFSATVKRAPVKVTIGTGVLQKK